jgi:SH3-like domain-containing protein
MERETRARLLANPGVRFVRWTVPWIALAALLYVVWGATADFRALKANEPAGGGTATSTVEATSTPVTGMTGTAKVDGVHVREVPEADGTVLSDLGKGATFEVLAKREGWYRIRDASGKMGWVTSDTSFVTVEQK